MDEEEYISHVLFLSLSLVCKWNTMKGESGEITATHSNLLQINSHVFSSSGISKQLQMESCLRTMV